LRTHPITSDRIADIENRVSKQPYLLLPDSLDFQLVRTKLLAAQKSTADALSYFDHALNDKKFGNPVAQRYGLILALLRSNNVSRAAQEMGLLLAQVKDNPMVETLAGRVKMAEKNDADTLAFYQSAVKNHPQYRALVYDYAEVLLQTGQAEAAIKLLNERITRFPADTTLYQLQARSYERLGKNLEQHQALAYSYAWQGNLRAAIEQLELAKRAGGSFYQMSIIESDLRELREMADANGKK
jgi:predicted Zn-dependent protease